MPSHNEGHFSISYGKMLLSHIMGMDYTMSIITLALLLLAEILVAIILIGVSIEICSYGWKNRME